MRNAFSKSGDVFWGNSGELSCLEVLRASQISECLKVVCEGTEPVLQKSSAPAVREPDVVVEIKGELQVRRRGHRVRDDERHGHARPVLSWSGNLILPPDEEVIWEPLAVRAIYWVRRKGCQYGWRRSAEERRERGKNGGGG